MIKSKEKPKKDNFDIKPEEMAKVGVHFGHRVSERHPKMEPYLAGSRNNIHIINLEKTAEKLREALNFIQELVSENKTLLFLGTKIQIKDLIKEIAIECDMPYISERWLGGTFTNFGTILKRIKYFKDWEKKRTEEDFEKYTKKERLEIDQEIKDLEIKFGGIKNLQSLPDAIFVSDMKKEEIAIKEAEKKGIKVIGIAHTNVDPALADYPIPANDDSISSVKYILEKVKEVILKTKSKVTSDE